MNRSVYARAGISLLLLLAVISKIALGEPPPEILGDEKLLALTESYYRKVQSEHSRAGEFDFASFAQRKSDQMLYAHGHVEFAYPSARIEYWRTSEKPGIDSRQPLPKHATRGTILIARDRITHASDRIDDEAGRLLEVYIYPPKMHGQDDDLDVLPWQMWVELRPSIPLQLAIDTWRKPRVGLRIEIERRGSEYTITKGFSIPEELATLTSYVVASTEFEGAITHYYSHQSNMQTSTKYHYDKASDGTVFLRRLRGQMNGRAGKRE